MGSFTITGEMLTLIFFIVFGILGIFRGISNIRVEMAERMTKVETDIAHMMHAMGIHNRGHDGRSE